MEHINESIINYLNMDTNGALLLTGDWGSGKTYHIKNRTFPAIKAETEFNPIIISLFGEKDLNDIPLKILSAYYDQTEKKTKKNLFKVKTITEWIPAINNNINLEKILQASQSYIFNELEKEKVLICFDDLERVSNNININDLTGFINELVENRKCKILLIANEDKIDGGISFKEKTIDKTLYYSPNIREVLTNLSNSYKEKYPHYHNFLIERQNFILHSLKYLNYDETLQQKVDTPFSNIRTLKYALEHFRVIFDVLKNHINYNTYKAKHLLRSLWTFTIALTIEHKKPQSILFNDKHSIDKHISTTHNPLIEYDLTNKSFAERFKYIYFDKSNMRYTFYIDLYNFITAGISINKKRLLATLDKEFNMWEYNKTSSNQRLLNHFNDDYNGFTNNNFKKQLSRLLRAFNNGGFDMPHSYMFAAYYCYLHHDHLGISINELTKEIKLGIEKELTKTDGGSLVMFRDEFEMNSFDHCNHTHNLRNWAINYTKKLLTDYRHNYIKTLEQYLLEDYDKFKSQLGSDHGSFEFQYLPILSIFDTTILHLAFTNWEPSQIKWFIEFLDKRYIKNTHANNLIKEDLFLSNTCKEIEKINLNEPRLSNLYLKKLIEQINKCKSKLSDIKKNTTDSKIISDPKPHNKPKTKTRNIHYSHLRARADARARRQYSHKRD